MRLIRIDPAGAPRVVEDPWRPEEVLTLEGLAARPPAAGVPAAPPLALRVGGEKEASALQPHLDRLALVVVEIPRFTDGRAYTLARLLRERHGYRGELRARGDVLREQLVYLWRCGFDAFELAPGQDLDDALGVFRGLRVSYTGDARERRPIWRRRAAGGVGLFLPLPGLSGCSSAMQRWLPRARVVGAVACFAASGGLAAWVLVQPEGPSLARASAGPTEVTVGAAEVPKGVDAAAFARDLAARWGRVELTLEVPGSEPVTRTRAAFGASLDVEALAASIEQARESTSAMRRVHAATGRPRLSLPLPVEVDESSTFELLADLADGYDRRAVDARIEPRTGRIRPHQHGRRLDVHRTLDALHAALSSGASTVRAVVVRERARRTEEELAHVDVSHVLGSYETRYSLAARSRDRSFNLRVAASKIDGLVVLPGEVFDFNEAVGERSEANGFRPAPVIAGGELVNGIGGGTCQVAGTLHAAAFFAGLPIVERSPHSRPSTYIFMGLDAVVSYPQLNLRFRNDLPTPIVIGFTVEGGVARAEIRGAPLERLVTLVRRVDSVAAYAEREVDDPSLPEGVRVLRQRGVPGFTITTFRIVRDLAANQATRERRSDTYPPTTQIWRVGTGGSAPEGYVPPEGDAHGEYTADAYLELTQGAGVRGTRILRRAGRSGSPGWTARMGFPQP